VFASAPGVDSGGGAAVARRSGLAISGRRDSWPNGRGRAAPNTHADSGGPTRQGRAAVPGTAPQPVPIRIRSRRRGHSKVRRALSPKGESRSAGLTGGAGRPATPPILRRRCGGGRGDLGRVLRHRARFNWDSFALSPSAPPTRLRGAARMSTADPKVCGHGRRPIQAAGCRGYGRGHPIRTRGPVTTGCHRGGWPRRLPLGVGSPAVPRLSASRSGGHRTPPWCAACGRRPGPACGPGRNRPWPCPASTPAG